MNNNNVEVEDIKVTNMNHEEFDKMIKLLNNTSVTHQYLLNCMKFNFSTSITCSIDVATGHDSNRYDMVYKDEEFMKKYTLTIEDDKLPYITKSGFKIYMKKDNNGNVIGVDSNESMINDSGLTFDDIEYFYDITVFITNYMEELSEK